MHDLRGPGDGVPLLLTLCQGWEEEVGGSPILLAERVIRPKPTKGNSVMDGNEASYLVVGAMAFLVAIVIGTSRGENWRRENPDKQSFTWGYIFSYAHLFAGIAAIPVALYLATQSNLYENQAIFLITLSLVYVVLAYFSLKRVRWSLVALTILSLNVVYWAINAVYLRNRWSELRPQHKSTNRLVNYKDNSSRIALFLAGAWIICVPAYVILFEPYGYVSGREFQHMLTVMLVPAGLGLAFFWIYRNYIK